MAKELQTIRIWKETKGRLKTKSVKETKKRGKWVSMVQLLDEFSKQK